MQKKYVNLIVVLMVALTSYFWGGLTVHKQIFPYEQLKQIKGAISASNIIDLPPNPMWLDRVEQHRLFGQISDVAMIGDSITHVGHWDDIFPSIKIANRGVGWDRTDDVLRRMDSIISVKPKKAFIMIGTNDFSMKRKVDDVFVDYLKIVDDLRKNNVSVYIQSTLECSVNICGDRIQKIRLLNEKLKQFSTKNGITYIDLNEKLSTEKDGLLQQFTMDGIHLNGSGYVEWSKSIAPFIKSS